MLHPSSSLLFYGPTLFRTSFAQGDNSSYYDPFRLHHFLPFLPVLSLCEGIGKAAVGGQIGIETLG